MPNSKSRSLAGIALFSDLSPKETEALERTCQWRRYAARDHIIDQDGESRNVFFIIEGSVRIANYSLSGQRITLDDLSSGAHFGELAALDGQPRSASAEALVESLLASLESHRFLEVLETHPSVAIKVMRHLAGIVRSSTDRIMDLSTLAAHNRVQAEILRRSRLSLDAGGPAAVSPVPKFGDLASRVSTTRETVSRVINDLARKGVLERTPDSLVVLDLDRLKSMVEKMRGE